ncbi:MAG: tetratricopeptide repeat protein [Qingshengfaniella sp.]
MVVLVIAVVSLRLDRSDPVDANFLKGAHAWQSGEPGATELSMKYFQAVLDTQPQHAESLAYLAEISSMQGAYDDAESYAVAALNAGPSARAYPALASIAAKRDWDWPSAAAWTDRAIEHDESFADAWSMKAMLATIRGDKAAAIAATDRAYKLAPVSALIRTDHGWFHYYAGEYETAMGICREAFELRRVSWASAYCRLKSARAANRPAEALDAGRDIYGLWTGASRENAVARITTLSEFDDWHMISLRTSFAKGAPLWEAMAKAEMTAGRTKTALTLLEEAHEQHSSELPLALRNPAFQPLYSDQRYAELINKTRIALK